MGLKILAINPGSTSTKIALYEDEKELLVKTLDHPVEEIEKFDKIVDQFQMRKEVVISFLKENGYEVSMLDA
ncbi:MAG: butyrate kinase, partial [Sedimentibacter sp.]|nr:butyrate kinase [Sedimentibacter sp.]